MWTVVGALMVFSWFFFLIRGRTLAKTLERCEVMLLKPLSIAYLLLAMALAISGAWFVAAVSALAFLLTGAIGASLHKSRTFTELTEGTLQYMQRGRRAPLSHVESRQVASVTLRAAMIFGVALAALLIHYWLRWYFALPVAIVAAWVFMVGSTLLVAYKRVHGP